MQHIILFNCYIIIDTSLALPASEEGRDYGTMYFSFWSRPHFGFTRCVSINSLELPFLGTSCNISYSEPMFGVYQVGTLIYQPKLVLLQPWYID